jgi:hypothetical protein
MKHYPAPPIPQEIADKIQWLIQEGVSQPQVIVEMRVLGLHIADCIKLTSRFYGIGITEAKKTVHNSDAWADLREQYDAFHERAWEAAKLAGFEEVEEGVALKSAS